MVKTWEVIIPIAGHAYATVQAETEAEAISKAMDEVRIKDVENWEPLKRFNEGNVCYCPEPWQAEATCDDDD